MLICLRRIFLGLFGLVRGPQQQLDKVFVNLPIGKPGADMFGAIHDANLPSGFQRRNRPGVLRFAGGKA